MGREANLRNTTYCSGYWNVANNQKRDARHYQKYLTGLFRRIGGGKLLLFFEDENFFKQCQKIADATEVSLRGHYLPLNDLPYAWAGDELLSACKRMECSAALNDQLLRKDKGIKHYHREFRLSGEEAYAKIMAIWMSKIPLISQVSLPSNPFNTDLFAWVDISIARFRFMRGNHDFTKQRIDSGRINHYGTDSYYRGSRLKLNASFMCGGQEAWERLNFSFRSALQQHLLDDYAHDEETILSHVQSDNPDLFRSIGETHRGFKKKALRLLGNNLPRILVS